MCVCVFTGCAFISVNLFVYFFVSHRQYTQKMQPGFPNPYVELPLRVPFGAATVATHIDILSADVVVALSGERKMYMCVCVKNNQKKKEIKGEEQINKTGMVLKL